MPEKKEKTKYIITTRKVDKFNLIRKRVPVSPAICQKCGEDLLALNKITEPWDDLPKSQQDALLMCMKDHDAKVHSKTSALIVEEDEIAGAWLGEKRGGEIPKSELPPETETLKKIKEKKGR